MAVTHLVPGRIEPIFYYQNQKGHIMLLPTHADTQRVRRYMGKLGYMLMSAETLPEAEKLQKKLQEQLKGEQDSELTKDEVSTYYRRQKVRERLVSRMNSAACNQYERDFIRLWLEAREKKHDLFRKRFTQEVGHLDALEFDNPMEHTHSLLDKT